MNTKAANIHKHTHIYKIYKLQKASARAIAVLLAFLLSIVGAPVFPAVSFAESSGNITSVTPLKTATNANNPNNSNDSNNASSSNKGNASAKAGASATSTSNGLAVTGGHGFESSVVPMVGAGSDDDPRLQLTEYYMTNDDFITPVKLQNPWGTCWAFAIAAAIESSILKAEQKIYSETPAGAAAAVVRNSQNSNQVDASAYQEPRLSGLNDSVDISERAIAWLAHEPQTEMQAQGQSSEGYTRSNSGDPYSQLMAGNFAIVEAALQNWQSLVPESAAPYQYNGYAPGGNAWYSTGSNGPDARLFDWSIDNNLRNSTEIGWRVSDVLHLQNPAIVADGIYQGYSASATREIKSALVNVGAVAISVSADTNLPEELKNDTAAPGKHINYSTWSQYDDSNVPYPNHAVTIVGWDDSYSASNFGAAESGQPPADGAWLCKNDWGTDQLFAELGAPNDAMHWGIRDATGATGFFWLSYYDHTIDTPTAFKVTPTASYYDHLYQHDYLGSSEFTMPSTFTQAVMVANVFTAQSPELVRAVTAQTYAPNEKVLVEIYTMGSRWKLNRDEYQQSEEDASSQAQNSQGSQGSSGSSSNSQNSSSSSDSSSSTMDGESGEDTGFPIGTKVRSFELTFEVAGFHTIPLEKPIVLSAGESFAVVEQVKESDEAVKARLSERGANSEGSENSGSSANSSSSESSEPDIESERSSYLPLELAFTTPSDTGNSQYLVPNVVSSPDETFVMLFSGQWMPIDIFNTWYEGYSRSTHESVDVIYGNALIKALTDDSSMAENNMIYEMVEL